MKTAPVVQILLALFTTIALLESHQTNGAPVKICSLNHYNTAKGALISLRNKYEELRFSGAEPWQNCSHIHLCPKWKLDDLTKWEKLEAVEMELNLTVNVLQNQSEPLLGKDAIRALEVLKPLRDDVMACKINHEPLDHAESEHFQKFKEQFYKFNSSNFEQSPQCLEVAVGLDIVSLLNVDVHQISQNHHHHHRRRPCHSSN